MHINNISQKAASFILHKRFHPGNFKNMEKVWLAEQRVADAARKDTELTQKRAQEMKIKELRQRNQDASGASASDLIHSSIQWVYAQDEPKTAAPHSVTNVDDSDKQSSRKSRSEGGKYILEEPSRFGQVSDVDLLRKLHEDPLMEIKKAEILRSRKAEVQRNRQFVVKRPRWDRQAPAQGDYILPEQGGSALPPSEAREARPRAPAKREESDDLASSDDDLGPSSEMRSIIHNRHVEAAVLDRKNEPADPPSSGSSAASAGALSSDALSAMIQRGREHEDQRKLRVDRCRSLAEAADRADQPRNEMPAFKTRLQASVLATYDREKALRSRRHDQSIFEDRKYQEISDEEGARSNGT